MSLIVRARHITTTVDGKPVDLSYGEALPDGVPKEEIERLRALAAVQDPGLPLPHQIGQDGFDVTPAPVVVTTVTEAADPEPYDAAAASDAELHAWLVHVKPVADDTIAAANGDAETAKRIAAAEQAMERPRKGVIEALSAITDKSA